MDRIRPQLSGTPALLRMIPSPVGPSTSFPSGPHPLLQVHRRRPPPGSGSLGLDGAPGYCRTGSKHPIPSWLHWRWCRLSDKPQCDNRQEYQGNRSHLSAPRAPIRSGRGGVHGLSKLPPSRRISTFTHRSADRSVFPFSFRHEALGFQMRSTHEAIGCAGAYQEESFPTPVGFKHG